MAKHKLEEQIQKNMSPILVLAIVAVSSFLVGSHLQPKRQTQNGTTTVSSDSSTSTPSTFQDIQTAAQQSQPAVSSTSSSTTNTKPTTSTSALVNINTANATELDVLPHVGPATAQKIIDYRTQHGPFKSVDDLINVPGIGPKTLEDIKPKATI